MPITIVLGNKKFSASRVKFRKWIELENIRNKAIDALKIGDGGVFATSLFSYLFFALDDKEIKVNELPWYEVTFAFDKLVMLNSPTIDFPMFKGTPEDKEEASWDYEGRTFYLWAHLLSSAYGWNSEYIAELDIDDALAFTQEILVERQLDREWQWSLSEIAYPYNPSTKKSEYKPLPRPDWMTGKVKEPAKTRILKEHVPVGIVLRWTDETPPTN